MKKILLTIPPFIQPNTTYPSVTQLSGYLNQKGYNASSCDLSVKVLLKLFSAEGLTKVFREVEHNRELDFYSSRMIKLKREYINNIDSVINFLKGNNNGFAYKIMQDGFLPIGESYNNIVDEKLVFGSMGMLDNAKYVASLFIQDIVKFIQQNISNHFGFSRYAESIAASQPEFENIEELVLQNNLINSTIIETVRSNSEFAKCDFLALSVPFPGNLVGALLTAKVVREINPECKIILGGGYVNTELRNLSDPAIFNYVDYITFDDGEIPIERIIGSGDFVRTMLRANNAIEYIEGGNANVVHTPHYDFTGINIDDYFSLIEIPNAMHKLWSDGFWNKMTLAHGCYWKKCTFCDVNLDYIGRYSPGKAKQIVDEIESIIAQTGVTSFHFTDEAAPPALLMEMAVEIIKRNINVTWWGNIRFEKSYSSDLCALLAKSGCIAVSGGIEVANERLLKKINKGVTIFQAANACNNFREAGILVHAYLMYGFPTQTAQETIDSLEVVRQFFANGLLDSAFWHKFILTRHSPVYGSPEAYKIKIRNSKLNRFANNDLVHEDISGANHDKFGAGLRKSLYNYMNGIGLDWRIQKWFDVKVPDPTLDRHAISNNILNTPKKLSKIRKIIWLGSELIFEQKNKKEYIFSVQMNSFEADFSLPLKYGEWLEKMVKTIIKRDGVADFVELSNNPILKENEIIEILQSDYLAEIRGKVLLLI